MTIKDGRKSLFTPSCAQGRRRNCGIFKHTCALSTAHKKHVIFNVIVVFWCIDSWNPSSCNAKLCTILSGRRSDTHSAFPVSVLVSGICRTWHGEKRRKTERKSVRKWEVNAWRLQENRVRCLVTVAKKVGDLKRTAYPTGCFLISVELGNYS